MRAPLSLVLFGLAAIASPVLWTALPWAAWLAAHFGVDVGYALHWADLPFAHASIALGMACVWWGLVRLLVRPDMTLGTAMVLLGATGMVAGFGFFVLMEPIWHVCYAILGAERTAALYPHYGEAWFVMPGGTLTVLLGPAFVVIGRLTVAFERRHRWRAA